VALRALSRAIHDGEEREMVERRAQVST
jgi:hypothetical protein